jgi:NAD(P)-dependent dehydrogenase (short-subunit alcohol dehydrogenase family)
MRLSTKVAIITGAGSGIGKAAALLFAGEGAQVVAGVYEPGDQERVEAEARGLAGAVKALRCDVTKERDAERLCELAVSCFGRLDILVNNAGIMIPGLVTETTDEEWGRLIDVNLKGAFLCSKYAVPAMLKNGGGSIVNNSSINAIRGNHRLVAYSASKGGVAALTRAMALDYAPHIRVNCVCPGTIDDTRMLEGSIADTLDKEKAREYFVAKHPMGRLGRPEEVARAILFLASDEASFITGVALPVDGGRSIR